MTQPNASPSSFVQQKQRNASRTRSPKRKSPSGRMSRWPCKDYLQGTCNNSFCEEWHPPECLFYKTKSGCRSGKSALMRIDRLKNSLAIGDVVFDHWSIHKNIRFHRKAFQATILLACFRGLSLSRIYPVLWHTLLPLHASALLHWR